MRSLICLCLCALLLTGCGGNADFVSAAVVEVETTEKESFLSPLEDWLYRIWYAVFADDKTRDAVDEAVESYENENGTISE